MPKGCGGWLRVLGTTLNTVDGRIAPTETTARFMIADAANVFTMSAPLAAGMLGLHPGDKTTVELPAGPLAIEILTAHPCVHV